MNIEEDTMAYYYILKHRIGLCMPSTCSIEDLGNVTERRKYLEFSCKANCFLYIFTISLVTVLQSNLRK